MHAAHPFFRRLRHVRRVHALALGALLALLAPAAQAHGSLDRLAPFYAGLLHPLLVPAQALALVALGLLVGQRGLAAGHHALTLLLVALLPSLALASAAAIDSGLALVALGLALGLCVLAAWQPSKLLLAVLAVLVGIGVGLGSAPERSGSTTQALMLAGTALGSMALATLVAAMADAARAGWARIGLRVLGSWLAASALLVLALAAAAPQPSSATTRPQVQNAASVPIT